MLKKTKLSSAIVSLMATTMFSAQHVYAEEAAEEVVVTGIRGALEKAMDIKREAVGVVDAISAEDMGKFPDTNLAESLQRITGVSIDRSNGEGSKITVRGFGGDNNMVTLNGRMMPAAGVYGGGSGAGGTSGAATRAFDFANLASESVAGIEVYKTGRASIATGGIGATVNIKTAKPLDTEGLKFSVGGKALMDSTNRTGSDVTPELSGLASWSDSSLGLGAGLSVSHSERDSGKSDITVNDWNIGRWTNDNDMIKGNKGLYSFASGATVTNAPKPGQLYGRPNDIRYAFSDTERTRDNAQLTLQWAPSDSFKSTLDYTYAKNDLKERRGETTSWLANGTSITEVRFDNSQAVAAPLFISEVAGPRDQGYEQQLREQTNELKSIGLNADWEVTDSLSLNFDVHNSKMDSMPAGPGNSGEIAVSMGTPTQVSHTLDFSHYTPLFNLKFNDGIRAKRDKKDANGEPVRDAEGNVIQEEFTDASGNPVYRGNNNGKDDAGDMGSQVVRVWYADQTNEISEARVDGVLKFDEGHFDFGAQFRTMENNNKSSQRYMGMGDWGIANVGDIPTNLIEPYNLASFDSLETGGSYQGGFKGKAELIGQALVDKYKTAKNGYVLAASTNYNTNSRVEEDTNAAYFQLALEGELAGMKTNFLAGLRYETTDVKATSFVVPPKELIWQDDNDFTNGDPSSSSSLTIKESSYDNMLPSLDFDISFQENLKGRFSFGQTIARAPYGSLSAAYDNYGSGGGTTWGGKTRTVNVGNPSLLPLQSTNVDLSLEWYYTDSSYVSAGVFEKRVSNFIGNEKTKGVNLFGIRDQTNAKSPRVIAALKALDEKGIAKDDRSLFVMMAILDNPNDFPNGANAYPNSGNKVNDNLAKDKIATKYDIHTISEGPNADPLTEWEVNSPVNNKEAKLYGAELAAQHFFGESGFGVQANYTIVRGDIGYKNGEDPSVSQFALLGLSDTMNIVGIYENYGVQARLAYNWRGSFLNNASKGSNRNPVYTEAYSQWDLSVGYNITDDLSVSFEGLNLTGEDRRDHGRTWNMVEYMEDLGPRYAVGARYNF